MTTFARVSRERCAPVECARITVNFASETVKMKSPAGCWVETGVTVKDSNHPRCGACGGRIRTELWVPPHGATPQINRLKPGPKPRGAR
jgi:hypothetical protein